jgi:cytochrome d ubiquinol oxidase subunit II
MEITWLFILAFMLTMFILLDGFDFGAGIISLFFARNKDENEKILKAIGPFWDGNEVWLIAGGGVMFAAFPLLYASAFSGLYLPLMLVLWMLVFRAVGLELAGLVDHELWRKTWHAGFGVASLMLALLLGIALGNIVRGFNLGGIEAGVAKYESYFFFTPLWNEHFSPTTLHPGVIDWFTLILGVIAVITLTIHGGNWLILKLSGDLTARLRKINQIAAIVLLAMIVLSVFAWLNVKPDSLSNFSKYRWLWIFPTIALVGLVGQLNIPRLTKDWQPFAFSSMFILGSFASTLAALFPVLLPSTNNIVPDLTIYNAAADKYGLEIGLIWWPIGLSLVIVYFWFLHKKFRGKLDDVDYH